MVASTFRSIVHTVRRHTVDTTTDIVYYSAEDWRGLQQHQHHHQHGRLQQAQAHQRHERLFQEVNRRLPAGTRLSLEHLPPRPRPTETTTTTTTAPTAALTNNNRTGNVTTTATVTSSSNILRVVVISDTHELHEYVTLPPCDLLLHCGDILQADSFSILNALSRRKLSHFFTWLNSQTQCRHRVVIGGNHDRCLEQLPLQELRTMASPSIYLEDDIVHFSDTLTMTAKRSTTLAAPPRRRSSPSLPRTGEEDGDHSHQPPHPQQHLPPPPPPSNIPQTRRAATANSSTSTSAVTRTVVPDPIAGLVIFGSPRSFRTCGTSPNKAFQLPSLWHPLALPMTHRELLALAPHCSASSGGLKAVRDLSQHHHHHHHRHSRHHHRNPNRDGDGEDRHHRRHRRRHRHEDKEGETKEKEESAHGVEEKKRTHNEEGKMEEAIDKSEEEEEEDEAVVLARSLHPVVREARTMLLHCPQHSGHRHLHAADCDSGHFGGLLAEAGRIAAAGSAGRRRGTNKKSSSSSSSSPSLSDDDCREGGESRSHNNGVPPPSISSHHHHPFDPPVRYACPSGRFLIYSIRGWQARQQHHNHQHNHNHNQNPEAITTAAATSTAVATAAATTTTAAPIGIPYSPTCNPAHTAAATTTTTAAAPLAAAGPPVVPLEGVHIAMTHMSGGAHGPLRALVEQHVRPSLLHCGGHVHELKGIHAAYVIAPSNDDEMIADHTNAMNNTTLAPAPAAVVVPSVGGALLRGSFGRERLSPPIVLDVPFTRNLTLQ